MVSFLSSNFILPTIRQFYPFCTSPESPLTKILIPQTATRIFFIKYKLSGRSAKKLWWFSIVTALFPKYGYASESLRRFEEKITVVLLYLWGIYYKTPSGFLNHWEDKGGVLYSFWGTNESESLIDRIVELFCFFCLL